MHPSSVLALFVSLAVTGPGLHVVDVGQGAALIAVGSEGDAVVVDSGPPAGGELLLRALLEHDLDRHGVAAWIHTHFDADHIGGLSRALAGVDGRAYTHDDLDVGLFWDRGFEAAPPSTEAFERYRVVTQGRRARAEAGARLVAPGLVVEVLELAPPPVDADENRRGLALCVEVGGLRALVPGDLPRAEVELAAQACGPVDVLWVSHHGAADGSSAAALEHARPRLAVLSAGADNAHCHPDPKTLAILRNAGPDLSGPALGVWILDGAGLGPGQACPVVAPALDGLRGGWVGGDLWIAPGDEASAGDPQLWLGGPGGWARANPKSAPQ